MLDLSSLKKAIAALRIAFAVYDDNKLADDNQERIVLRDGVIQRFEFTFELSWKMLKRYLEEYGLEKVDGLNNRELFRIGFEQGLLNDPEVWFYYLKMRNQTSHVYDEAKADMVFTSARSFLLDAESLLERLVKKIHD